MALICQPSLFGRRPCAHALRRWDMPVKINSVTCNAQRMLRCYHYVQVAQSWVCSSTRYLAFFCGRRSFVAVGVGDQKRQRNTRLKHVATVAASTHEQFKDLCELVILRIVEAMCLDAGTDVIVKTAATKDTSLRSGWRIML